MTARPVLVSRIRFPGLAFERAEHLFDVRVLDASVRDACLRGEHPDAAAIWTSSEVVDDALLDVLPHLRAVGNQGVGVDTVDTAALERRGVALCRPTGANADAVADHVFGLLLAVSHQIAAGDRFIREGRWAARGEAEPMGWDVTGRTIGIVGLGAIGHAVARRAPAFGLRVVGWNRTPRPVAGVELLPLAGLLAVAAILTLHVALTPDTRGLIGARELSLLPRGAILVNAARGAVVDTEAMIAALAEGQLWGAGLDVFDAEPAVDARLLAHPRVVVTPHNADIQPGAEAALTNGVVEGLERVFGPA